MILEIIIQALWCILPAYIANASALLVGGGTPLDFGKCWKDNRRILGNGKTWRGLLSGAFIGMTAGFGLSAAAKYINTTDFAWLSLNDFMGFPMMIPLIFSLCFGALLGDITESFFKRRIGKDRGEDWLIFDQLDFIIGALALSFLMSTLLMVSGLVSSHWFFTSFSLWHLLVLVTFTPFFHLFANFVHRKTARRATPEKVK